MEAEYYLTGDGNIAQGDTLIYEMDFAEEEVTLKAIALLNQGKGLSGWDELFDELIKDGCEETASGCMRIAVPVDPMWSDYLEMRKNWAEYIETKNSDNDLL